MNRASRYYLRPIKHERLREALAELAHRAEVTWDGGLLDRLVADAEPTGATAFAIAPSPFGGTPDAAVSPVVRRRSSWMKATAFPRWTAMTRSGSWVGRWMSGKKTSIPG